MSETNVTDRFRTELLFDPAEDARLLHHQGMVNRRLQNANRENATLDGVRAGMGCQKITNDRSPGGRDIFEKEPVLQSAFLGDIAHEVGDLPHGPVHDRAVGYAAPVRDHPMPQLLQRCGRWDKGFLDHDVDLDPKVAPA